MAVINYMPVKMMSPQTADLTFNLCAFVTLICSHEIFLKVYLSKIRRSFWVENSCNTKQSLISFFTSLQTIQCLKHRARDDCNEYSLAIKIKRRQTLFPESASKLVWKTRV